LTDDTITQVAYAVGYNDDKYFLRAFKNSTGVTPSAYRLKRAKSDAAAKLASRERSNPTKHSLNGAGKSRTGGRATA
jgi:AraC-like DNA-binding protein